MLAGESLVQEQLSPGFWHSLGPLSPQFPSSSEALAGEVVREIRTEYRQRRFGLRKTWIFRQLRKKGGKLTQEERVSLLVKVAPPLPESGKGEPAQRPPTGAQRSREHWK